jgi:hypothetical protein
MVVTEMALVCFEEAMITPGDAGSAYDWKSDLLVIPQSVVDRLLVSQFPHVDHKYPQASLNEAIDSCNDMIETIEHSLHRLLCSQRRMPPSTRPSPEHKRQL